MAKSESQEWLLELTQSITGQLKQHREDISLLWEELRQARQCHVHCREHILSEIAKLDKRIEVLVVRISIYVAIATFVVTTLLEFVFKHWINP